MSNNYLIRLTGLRLFGYHGVLAHEQQYGQEFLVDCAVDVVRAAEDEISATVSYADLADLIEASFKAQRFELLESLADQLLAAVLSLSPLITRAELTVHKPAAPLSQRFTDVAVTVLGERFAAG